MPTKILKKKRCAWIGDWSKINPIMLEYHDTEWGVPLHDDQKLFEFLTLDAFQAGLNWEIVLNKRKNFKRAFNNFNFGKIARYTKKDVKRLLSDAGIIRNRLKIQATITNAKEFLKVKKEFGSFDRYIWQFVNHKTIQNRYKSLKDLPAKSAESDAMSRDLKGRGFKFVGSTICYAFMQAIGMVNDHTIYCFRYREVQK
ncbi:DNA-3-methyladenine glycosylase I [Thermoproteota archaeon]